MKEWDFFKSRLTKKQLDQLDKSKCQSIDDVLLCKDLDSKIKTLAYMMVLHKEEKRD